jgi:UDP-N-acetylmuramoylalanine--D-glutamate ligase
MSADERRVAAALDLSRDWTGRRVTVMGLGLFGGGATVARAFARRGARVTVTDLRSAEVLEPSLRALAGLPLELVLGEHRAADFTGAELVVANPAVRPDHELLALARAHGATVAGEIELFLANVRARVACVTGTQGKSSVCHVLHGLLERSGVRAVLGGNIGTALVDRAL